MAVPSGYGYSAPEIRVSSYDAPAPAPAVRTESYGSYSAAPALKAAVVPIVKHMLRNDNSGNYNLE